GEVGENTARERDVPRFDPDPGPLEEGPNDRQERIAGERRRLVSQSPLDGRVFRFHGFNGLNLLKSRAYLPATRRRAGLLGRPPKGRFPGRQVLDAIASGAGRIRAGLSHGTPLFLRKARFAALDAYNHRSRLP